MHMSLKGRDSYFAENAGQLPALGRKGQQTLRHARVHLSGTGRIGTAVALNLTGGGVGYISANDPQSLEAENLGSFPFVRRSDLKEKKVYVLEKHLDGRPNSVFEALAAGTESRVVDPLMCAADIIVSSANTLSGRLAAERKAVRFGKPILQAAALDGRDELGGLITLRLPGEPWSACFGCYFANRRAAFPRNEGLLTTVTSTVAALTSNLVVQILTGGVSDFLRAHNLFLIDLTRYSVDALAVERLSDCRVCGAK